MNSTMFLWVLMIIFPTPDNSEVAAWKYISPDLLKTEIENHPEKFTEWFKICMKDWYAGLTGIDRKV